MTTALEIRELVETLQEENRQLREMLKPPTTYPAEWRLSQQEVELLTILAARAPSAMSKSLIYDALFFDKDEPPQPKIVDVVVSKLRSKLKTLGVEIETIWGFGYRMGIPARDRLRAAAATDEQPIISAERPAAAPTPEAKFTGEEIEEMHTIVMMKGGSIEASAKLDSETALEEFVRRLWCAAEGIWPTQEQESEEEPDLDAQPAARMERRAALAQASPPKLTDVQASVLRCSQEEPAMSAVDMAARLNCSQQSIYNARARLRELGLLP